ncbi:MAG: hypothetical protein ACTSYC_08885 [Promethearchaeota archaeon]
MENKKWIITCIIGGILMFISSIVGNVSFFILVFEIASNIIGPESAVVFSIILQVFFFIAMGGGISVIIGALIVALNQYRIGKFIIGLGAGMGLIGLIIFFITSLIAGSFLSDLFGIFLGILNGTYGFLGVILTILARFKLKKDKES